MANKSRRNRPTPGFAADNTAVEKKTDGEETPVQKRDPEQLVTRFGVLFAHVVWFFLGPLTLLMILFGIVNVGSGWATVLDAVFFLLVVLIIGCRWIDQRSGQGTTDSGEPSTWDDFRRYALFAPIIAGVAWITANVLGNYCINQ